MGAKYSNLKHGPGLIIDKRGNVIDSADMGNLSPQKLCQQLNISGKAVRYQNNVVAKNNTMPMIAPQKFLLR